MVRQTAVMVFASAVGSWPGRDVDEALRTIRGELADHSGAGVSGVPYLPVLPGRGAAAGLLARTAGLLVDLSVDLQPQGWRLVDRPGRELSRIGSAQGEDLDHLAEIFHGWSGPFVLQTYGPWSLAAELWLPRGDRVLGDPGALRDLADSLTEGLHSYRARVAELLPGAELTVLLHEPRLSAVLAGEIRSDSGLRALRIPDRGEARAVLRGLAETVTGAGSGVGIHTATSARTLEVAVSAGIDALSVDLAGLDDAAWEVVAPFVEAGQRLWAAVVPLADGDADLRTPRQSADRVLDAWHRIGLEQRRLADLTLTPVTGLAELTPDKARRTLAATVESARILAELLLD